MQKSIIKSEDLAKPSGYSHGILTEGGRLLFLSGQPGLDKAGKIESPGDLEAQFRLALGNIKAVISAAGGQMTDIVKMQIFCTDKELYKAHLGGLGDVYRAFFGKYYPATTFIECKGLFDDGSLVEIDTIAVLK
jgi:enamine deaminase RidA (YjgF/YER057c/UK114 family)